MEKVVNFSDAMAKAVNIYGSHCYIDKYDYKNDGFICPKCKDFIVYIRCCGNIEKDGDKYICPICHQKF